MSSPDIFLSYNREDQAVAQRFAEGFEAAELSVWWDVTLRSGETYDTVTEQALRTAKAVVVLWSPRSVDSRWVRAEATLADRNRTLVPARIESCDLPIMFELTQTADLAHWQGDARDPVWRAFLGDVRKRVGATAEPAGSVAQSRAQSSGNRPTLAILPFVSRSGLLDDDDFAEDLVEDLIAALSFSPWLEVLARSAAAPSRGGVPDLRQIGRELGAAYLFVGKLRRTGDELRLTVQLIAAEEGKVLWTQRFDAPLAELATAQDSLVTDIAAGLGVQVERVEQEHALRKTGGFSAWEHFIRAAAHSFRASRASYEASVAEGRRAQQIDPAFPLAYAVTLAGLGPLTIYREGDPDLEKEIVETIRRVREIDPDNPTVLAGCVAGLIGLHRAADALPFGERAVALNPKVDYLHGALGSLLIHLGRIEDGLAEFDAEERLTKDTIRTLLSAVMRSVAYMHVGRLEEALAASDRAVRMLVSSHSLTQRALCLAVAGREAEARDAMRRARDADPGITRRQIGSLVRYYHFGLDAVDEYIAIACKLWNETGGDP